VANRTQQAVNRFLGDGQANRLDYSTRNATSVPNTQQSFDALRRAAHDAGPGSDAWADYHALLQQGLDRDQLPDVAGGGVPRSVADTAGEIGAVAERAPYFSQAHPLLHQYGWEGVSFADMGPEMARQVIALQAADALPHERAAWAALATAMDDSSVSTLGISWEVPDQALEWNAPMNDDNAGDPFSTWFNSRNTPGSDPSGLAALAMRGSTDPDLYGVDMGTVGGGGGTWHADLHMAQQSAANGLAMHQGDASLDVISQQ